MAVTNVGLSAYSSESADYANGFKVHAGDASAHIYLKWQTISGPEINATFDIAVNYRYIPSGNLSGETAGYTDWQTDWSTYATLPVADCDGKQVDGKWQWSYDLASLLDACGVKEAFTDSDTFGFALRKFDQAQIDIHIKSNYVAGFKDGSGKTYSPRTDVSVWIGYVPEYEIEGIYVDNVESVVIEYSAAGWGRADDRWELEAFSVDGESLLSSKPWGTVVRPYDATTGYGNGRVVVPMDKLTRIPVGESITAKVRFNASYRASGAEFADAEGTETCATVAGCNDPVLTLTREGDSIKVAVAADASMAACLVKLVGAEFDFDQKVIEPGKSARFDYLPKDVPLSFSALGMTSGGKVSNLVSKTAPAIASTSEVMVASLFDCGIVAAAKLNVKLDETYSPSRKTLKLAGRKRESVFYGEGGSASWSLSFSVLPQSAEPDPACQRTAWYRVADNGDCVMFRNGERRRVSIGSVKFSMPYNTGGAVTASVSLTEVS